MLTQTIQHTLETIDQVRSNRDGLGLSDFAYQENHTRCRTAMTYASNAIEGNTLTHSQTSIILEDGLSVSGKKVFEIQEALNHARAIDYIYALSQSISINQISQNHIQQIHAYIVQDVHSDGGHYRSVPVRLQGSQSILPDYMKVPILMDGLDLWIREANAHPCIMASELHYRFVSIHPFVDGNGRTARLLANLVLMIAGYPMMIIYPDDRATYIQSLENRRIYNQENQYHETMLGYMLASINAQLAVYA